MLFANRLVILGFGSIGQGVLPLILRHIEINPDQITIITGDKRGEKIAKKYGVNFFINPLTRDNYKSVLKPFLKKGDVLLHLAVDVSSNDIIDFCQQKKVIYLDTCTEVWSNSASNVNEHLNYTLREGALNLKKKYGAHSTTAVITLGANPGLVSCFVKEALVQIARDTGVFKSIPTSRKGWAMLAKKLNIKTIHIAEEDTQVCVSPKNHGEFVNSWSVDSFIVESLQMPELGWGSHEKYFPTDGERFTFGCKAAISLKRKGMSTLVRTWTPLGGNQVGFLITHNESISIADYLTIGSGDNPKYRPTVHFAYTPCDDARRSLQEFDVRGWKQQDKQRVIIGDVVKGVDELGVLLMGHKKQSYWYGSRLSIKDARKLAPNNNATSLQVSAGVLAGMIWAIKNPNCGIVEPEEIPHEEILRIAKPYLGIMIGEYSDWTPLQGRIKHFAEDVDENDPWQFKNFLV